MKKTFSKRLRLDAQLLRTLTTRSLESIGGGTSNLPNGGCGFKPPAASGAGNQSPACLSAQAGACGNGHD